MSTFQIAIIAGGALLIVILWFVNQQNKKNK